MARPPNTLDRSGYLSEQTIAAISTQLGGAIAIVRLSGARAFEILAQVIYRSNARENVRDSSPAYTSEPGKLVRADLFLASGVRLDDALFVRFIAPHSYTGENLVEFHLHGSSYISQRLMETLLHYEARQALPGEFSFRAVRHGKMTLFQAQAVADLIGASNDGAIALALEKLTGIQNQRLERISTRIKTLAALGEVGIDFSDQDVDEVSLPRLKEKLSAIIHDLEHLRDSFSRGNRLQEGVGVVFVGLPNAGKSSFFNAILGEDRSIVSDLAGTTRDLIREKITLKSAQSSVTLRLEDTAGLRITAHPVEKIGIERTHTAIQRADLVLFVVDPRAPFDQVQEQWLSLVAASSRDLAKNTLGILTHSDQLSPIRLNETRQKIKSLGINHQSVISSLTGAGISAAVEDILKFCTQWTERGHEELLLTRIEHLHAVREALENLGRAAQAPEIDLFASDIRQALRSLGPLIGEVLPDDILGEIFSSFCIGK